MRPEGAYPLVKNCQTCPADSGGQHEQQHTGATIDISNYYSYDSFGNRISKLNTKTGSQYDATFDARNILTKGQVVSGATIYFDHDASQRLLRRRITDSTSSHYFTHDQLDRVLRVQILPSIGSIDTTEMGYAATGERVAKRDATASSPAYMAWDGQKILTQGNAGGSAMSLRYRHNQTPSEAGGRVLDETLQISNSVSDLLIAQVGSHQKSCENAGPAVSYTNADVTGATYQLVTNSPNFQIYHKRPGALPGEIAVVTLGTGFSGPGGLFRFGDDSVVGKGSGTRTTHWADRWNLRVEASYEFSNLTGSNADFLFGPLDRGDSMESFDISSHMKGQITLFGDEGRVTLLGDESLSGLLTEEDLIQIQLARHRHGTVMGETYKRDLVWTRMGQNRDVYSVQFNAGLQYVADYDVQVAEANAKAEAQRKAKQPYRVETSAALYPQDPNSWVPVRDPSAGLDNYDRWRFLGGRAQGLILAAALPRPGALGNPRLRAGETFDGLFITQRTADLPYAPGSVKAQAGGLDLGPIGPPPPRAIWVDVGGEGRNPGVINLNPGARLALGQPPRMIQTTPTTESAIGAPIPLPAVRGRGQSLPFADRSVDKLIYQASPQDADIVAEGVRVIKPGGTIDLTYPQSVAPAIARSWLNATDGRLLTIETVVWPITVYTGTGVRIVIQVPVVRVY